MNSSPLSALFHNFLGHAPEWYKKTILAFLLINPLLFVLSPFLAGWVLIIEFIFTLALALKCYPLQPGGLLALEAVVIGMAPASLVYHEVENNLPVILLLVFMVAGIYFMKDLLLFLFAKILLSIRSKIGLSLIFSLMAGLLSAFLDALTVTAVIITVGIGFYSVYHKVASGKESAASHNHQDDSEVQHSHHSDLEQFRAFLRSLLMHAAVGTALGGVCTQVGEPQNLLIAARMDWNFIDFFVKVAPVSMPVLAIGLLTCYLLEKYRWFGYGATLPDTVRQILADFNEAEQKKLTVHQRMKLMLQALAAILLVLCLAFHLAEVGLIGLMIIVLLTAGNGIIEEHRIGKAFEEALPFTALLVVFFAIVAVIHEQHLFNGIIQSVLAMDEAVQPGMFFIANGLLSMISDNVFVATVYIDEVVHAFKTGQIDRAHLEALAIAINTGTNLPSVATPNGQAAFLFLLTSALAPLIRLSYGTMVWMALPYTITMSGVGYLMIVLFIA